MAGAGTLIASYDQVRVQPHLGRILQCSARCRLPAGGAVPTFAARSSWRHDITRGARARPAKAHYGAPIRMRGWTLDGAGKQEARKQATACCGDTSLIANWRRTSQIARGTATCGSVGNPRALGHQHHQHHQPTVVTVGERRRAMMRRSGRPGKLEQQCECAVCLLSRRFELWPCQTSRSGRFVSLWAAHGVASSRA
jgi:hypothetical protein